MKKLIRIAFALLLLSGSVVALFSCNRDEGDEAVEVAEGTRELTQNGITARIEKEQWGFNGTVLYVTVKLTKQNSGATPSGKVSLQAKTTDGEVLNDYGSGTFGGYWNGDTHYVQTTIHFNNKSLKANSLTITGIQVN